MVIHMVIVMVEVIRMVILYGYGVLNHCIREKGVYTFS